MAENNSPPPIVLMVAKGSNISRGNTDSEEEFPISRLLVSGRARKPMKDSSDEDEQPTRKRTQQTTTKRS
jgi:hypothetical protein